MEARDVLYIIFGYLCGSVVFARVFGKIFHKDVTAESDDKNPGTFNAFKYGGFLLGTLTLLGDLAKGIIPVRSYIRGGYSGGLALALIIAAPVIGHIFPLFFKFRGGKGIAVSFGTLLGLFPLFILPAVILAAAFIFFSLAVKVSPHYYRTIAAYGAASLLIVLFSGCPLAVSVGFLLSAAAITAKLLASAEQKEELEVKLAWKH